jgi:ATP-binding cassette subfamily B protein
MSDRALLSNYLKPQWRRVVLLAVLLVCGLGLALVSPQVVRFFIDSAMRKVSGEPLILAAIVYLLAAFARQGVGLAAGYLGQFIAWKSTNALRADLALHCLRLDLPFHKLHAPGELIERIDGDVGALGHYLSAFSVEVAGNTLLLLGVIVALYGEDWRIGAGVSLYVVLALALLYQLQNLGVRQWADSQQAEAAHYSFLEERLLGTEDIRSAGAERYILDRLHQLTLRMLGTHRTARLVSNFTTITTGGLHAMGYAIGLGIGIWLYQNGQISIGTAYMIVAYIALLAGPLDSLRRQVQDLQQAGAAIGRVGALFAQQPTVRDVSPGSHKTLSDGPLAVDMEGLSFRYDQDALALDDVSIHIAPGEIVGVLGRTGSGKSTLTRLLFRLYDPQAGVIRLGGIDSRDVALSDLRNRIALVTQDVQLFGASIRDNLVLFNHAVPDEWIEAGLRELGLWEWAQARGGLDGVLAQGERGLSAGEGQLLAFVRTFLKNPGLVVLDEASSRLDPGTEQLLDRAVRRLMADRTGIIIAHRLRTVQRADSIVIFERGRVVESGGREALARDPNSRFYRLLQVGMDDLLGDETLPETGTSEEHVEPFVAVEGVAR